MRVDGYWFNDEGVLDIFVADFECRRELETLTRTDVDVAFNAQPTSSRQAFRVSWTPTSPRPNIGLIRQIAERRAMLQQVNFYLTSERALSDRFQALPDGEIGGIRATYHIWDMTRFQRQRSSRGHKEPLRYRFRRAVRRMGSSCLPANLGSNTYTAHT